MSRLSTKLQIQLLLFYQLCCFFPLMLLCEDVHYISNKNKEFFSTKTQQMSSEINIALTTSARLNVLKFTKICQKTKVETLAVQSGFFNAEKKKSF
jgi:hypothetical protein